MSVDIDEARRDDTSGCFNFFVTLANDFANGNDSITPYGNIRFNGFTPRSINNKAISDDNIEL